MKTLKVLAAIAILGVIAFLLFIYSGVYNVAATEPHIGFTYWVFNTTMKNSVQSRAEEIKVPPLLDPSLMKKGFVHYRETCVTCHGAPGVKLSEIGKGLMPEPPDLAKSAEKWTPAELYWIIKHGIKMTGMPEWGSGHKEEELLALAAFVKRLPELSPEQYQTMEQEAGDNGQSPRQDRITNVTRKLPITPRKLDGRHPGGGRIADHAGKYGGSIRVPCFLRF